MDDKPVSLGKRLIRWGALALGTLTWGSGIAAMYGDDYKLAVCLYFVGIAIVAADFITLEDHSQYRGFKKFVMIGATVLVSTLAFALSVAWIQLRKTDVQSQQESKPAQHVATSENTVQPEIPEHPKSNHSSVPSASSVGAISGSEIKKAGEAKRVHIAKPKPQQTEPAQTKNANPSQNQSDWTAVRAEISRRATSGADIIEQCKTLQERPDLQAKADAWFNETYNYLLSVDPGFATTFRNHSGYSFSTTIKTGNESKPLPEVNQKVLVFMTFKEQALAARGASLDS